MMRYCIVILLLFSTSCIQVPSNHVQNADSVSAGENTQYPHRALVDSTYGVVCYWAGTLNSNAGSTLSCVRFR